MVLKEGFLIWTGISTSISTNHSSEIRIKPLSHCVTYSLIPVGLTIILLENHQEQKNRLLRWRSLFSNFYHPGLLNGERLHPIQILGLLLPDTCWRLLTGESFLTLSMMRFLKKPEWKTVHLIPGKRLSLIL